MMLARRKFLTVSVALIVCTVLVAFILTQEIGVAAPLIFGPLLDSHKPPVITVVGQGQTRVRPDVAEVTLRVDFKALTLKDGMEQMNSVVKDIVATLIEMGISEEDIQISNFSMYSQRSFNNVEGDVDEIENYFVSNSIRINIRDLSQLDAILATALEAGATRVDRVKFGVLDSSVAESEARQMAVADAQDHADALALLSGVKVGLVYHVSEVVTNSLAYLEYPYGVTISSPRQIDVIVQVQITYTIE